MTSATSSISNEAGTFSYDNAGNMTGDGSFTFRYSSRNMPLEAKLTSTGATIRYQYGAAGLRTLNR